MFYNYNLNTSGFFIGKIVLGKESLYYKYFRILFSKYDLVCFLGIFHKLFFTNDISNSRVRKFYSYRKNVFLQSVNMCKRYYAIDTSLKCLKKYDIFNYMDKNKFKIKYREDVFIKGKKPYCYVIWEKIRKRKK